MSTFDPSIQTNNSGCIINFGDIEIYYEEYGAGEPLLLLHGFGGSVLNWHTFIEPLSKNYRLILVDLRGHGYSTNPGNIFSHRQAGIDVYLLLDYLGIECFAAMGISSGGMTLLHMATSQPQRVSKMVVISATTHFPEQARTIMRRASFATMPQQVKEMYRACAKHGNQQVQQLIAQFNALGENYEDMNFTPENLAAITAHTLIVHGENDQFFPLEIPIAMARAIPNAELWLIPGGEHVPIYDDGLPFSATAVKFLQS